jgi:hypothetical protein
MKHKRRVEALTRERRRSEYEISMPYFLKPLSHNMKEMKKALSKAEASHHHLTADAFGDWAFSHTDDGS